MKIEKIDIIWGCLAVVIVGVTFHFGYLLYGIVGIYLLMAGLFFYHIFTVKKRTKKTEAVYGRITGYKTVKDIREYHYPLVDFETTEGELISTVSSMGEKEQEYSVGDEELICYDPDDPMYFYFASREKELTAVYYRAICFGAVPAAGVLIAALAIQFS